MRNFLFAAIVCLGLRPQLVAQVTVEIVLDQDQFLPRETLRVGARITNFSGQTLQFGGDKDWLSFAVERQDGTLVPQQGTIPVEGVFDVESSTVATKWVDIAPYVDLTVPGQYRITATVRIPSWAKDIGTRPKDFNVVAGTRLWEQSFGVPDSAGEGRPPEVRKYALQQALHLKQMKLYVRVTDENASRYFGVFPLGPMISFTVPEEQIDRTNNLHVLHQTGPRAFTYSVVNPDGKLVLRQTHDYTATRPTLRAGADGTVMVAGGARRIAINDIPASPEPAALTNDVSRIKP
jgi:hypothetical protein